MAPDQVLDFWFADGLALGWPSRPMGELWFGGGGAVDTDIRTRFGPAVEDAVRGGLAAWEVPVLHRLALVILLDQFTRNVFRGQARAFAGDPRARDLAARTLLLGEDATLPLVGRVFMAMPLMHAEDPGSQAHCVRHFEALLAASDAAHAPALQKHLEAAHEHRDIVAAYGRFPHRNATLGRSSTAELKALADAARTWDGRASADSASYRIVRAWRLAVVERIQNGLLAPAQAALGERFVMPDLPQMEAVAWPLLQQRPAHLLPRKFESWDSLLADAARDIHGQLSATGPLAERTWGERNTAAICHPLAGALPAPARGWLCMPADPLPGDGNMPRVQGPGFGASQRMVVSPGREADGIIHMPGGQSGHPFSPFWGAGHAAWVRGEATSFLPGEPEHRLQLTPET